MKTRVLWLMAVMITCTSAQAEPTKVVVSAGTGVHRTHTEIVDFSMEIPINPNFAIAPTVGVFSSSGYAGAGAVARWQRLHVGAGGVYLTKATDRLTGHFQFKLSASLDLFKIKDHYVRLTYFHFSNGTKSSDCNSNYGEDFLALAFTF